VGPAACPRGAPQRRTAIQPAVAVRVAAGSSALPEFPTGITDSMDYVRAITERLAAFTNSARKAIDQADKLGDADTADLFTEISRSADKEGPMPLPPTVLTALGVEQSSPPRTGRGAGALGRLERSQLSEMPLLVCFPRDDPRFVERAQALLDGSHAEGPFASTVQALLRETYPLAVVRPRHALAGLGGGTLWYAFRDGSVVPIVKRETP
jgi:hypothetical protein